jgi:hypothetical protein
MKNTVTFILIYAAVILALFGAVLLLARGDAKQAQKYEAGALPIGVAEAKHKCQEEGLPAESCGGITGTVTTDECSGKTCWLVQAATKDPGKFAAAVTISFKSDRYVIIDYAREQISSN